PCGPPSSRPNCVVGSARCSSAWPGAPRHWYTASWACSTGWSGGGATPRGAPVCFRAALSPPRRGAKRETRFCCAGARQGGGGAARGGGRGQAGPGGGRDRRRAGRGGGVHRGELAAGGVRVGGRPGRRRPHPPARRADRERAVLLPAVHPGPRRRGGGGQRV